MFPNELNYDAHGTGKAWNLAIFIVCYVARAGEGPGTRLTITFSLLAGSVSSI